MNVNFSTRQQSTQDLLVSMCCILSLYNILWTNSHGQIPMTTAGAGEACLAARWLLAVNIALVPLRQGPISTDARVPI